MEKTIEELRDEIVELNAKYNELQEAHNAELEKSKEKDNTISKLTEYNNKLFQKVTTPVAEQAPEKSREDTIADIVSSFKGKRF